VRKTTECWRVSCFLFVGLSLVLAIAGGLGDLMRGGAVDVLLETLDY